MSSSTVWLFLSDSIALWKDSVIEARPVCYNACIDKGPMTAKVYSAHVTDHVQLKSQLLLAWGCTGVLDNKKADQSPDAAGK